MGKITPFNSKGNGQDRPQGLQLPPVQIIEILPSEGGDSSKGVCICPLIPPVDVLVTVPLSASGLAVPTSQPQPVGIVNRRFYFACKREKCEFFHDGCCGATGFLVKDWQPKEEESEGPSEGEVLQGSANEAR